MATMESERAVETDRSTQREAATIMGPVLTAIFGGSCPVTMEFWDGSRFADGPDRHVVYVKSPDMLRRVLWAPGELGLARAYVVGDFDTEAPVAEVLRLLQSASPDKSISAVAAIPAAIRAARELDALGGPLPPPDEEIVPRGRRHSIRRDKTAVSHHYDVGNDFYRLLLGPSMTYSCARFLDDQTGLDEAQAAKHELICRKLGLHDPPAEIGARPMRLLDVGCGWGEMVIHAATHHGVEAVGVTISNEQASLARKRAAEAGVADRVEIRIQDYREVNDGPYDAISSIGMAEHVGGRNLATYFSGLHHILRPGGRMLNHAIASIGGSKMTSSGFVGRYVFPDGELIDIAESVAKMEEAGFEVRDVENLREHYAQTLRHWVANLEEHWDDAVSQVGERRARIWLLYLSGSINGFDDCGLQIYQTLGVKTMTGGASGMPWTRTGWG